MTGPPAPAKVETERIAETSLVEQRVFLGEVRNAQSTVLAAGGSGKVQRVEVREGDEVSRGKVLVQLDDGVLRARLREVQAGLGRAEVELEQAQRDATRVLALSEQGHFPSAEAEQVASRRTSVESGVAGQQAAVERLREEIAQMRIVAPFDGVVSRRHVSPGQWLSTGESAIDVTSRESLEVHVSVPAPVLDLLADDTQVTLSSGTETVPGTIAGVVGSLDPRTRTALLRVIPTEPRLWLREGGAIDVSIALRRAGKGVVVSTDALVHGAGGTRVFRVSEGKAEPHSVAVIVQVGDTALVQSSELEVGDEVVRRGNERLRPGQDVRVGP